jgi:PAS domain-containing protein
MHSHKKSRAIVIVSLLMGFIIAQGIIYFTKIHGKTFYVSESILLVVTIAFWTLITVRDYLAWSDLKRYKAELDVKILNKHSAAIRDLLETVKKSEYKYQQLIEHAVYAIYITDLNGNITDANTSMCILTGYSKDELLNLDINSIIDRKQSTLDIRVVPKIMMRRLLKQSWFVRMEQY